MRAVKQALAADLRADPELAELVPATSVYAVERATLPTLPAVEIIGIPLRAGRLPDPPRDQHRGDDF